jgi:hypothetical protein
MVIHFVRHHDIDVDQFPSLNLRETVQRKKRTSKNGSTSQRLIYFIGYNFDLLTDHSVASINCLSAMIKEINPRS